MAKHTCKNKVVQSYINGVLDGSIVAGKLVKLAIIRHLKDLEKSKKADYPFEFSEPHGQYYIDCITSIHHYMGPKKGEPFILDPWQQFIIWCVFGWIKKSNKKRRFTKAFIFIARKNGKTTLAAAIIILLMSFDAEASAEVYSVATKEDQAKIIFNITARFIKNSPLLKKEFTCHKKNIVCNGTDSVFRPLGRDSDTQDGLNVHGAVFDETHAYKSNEIINVVEEGMGAREQPLAFEITTAGYSMTAPAKVHFDYAKQLLEGVIDDDPTFFCFPCCLDEEDDWTDERNWVKANPAWESIVNQEQFRQSFLRAKKIVTQQNSFKTKRLNLFVQQKESWLDFNVWQQQGGVAIDRDAMAGLQCVGAIDLSSVSDLTVWMMMFTDKFDNEKVYVLCDCWCPEEKIYDESNQYRNQYVSWNTLGFVKSTPGNAIDYDIILESVKKDIEKYNIGNISVDLGFQGYKFCQDLQNLFPSTKILGVRTNMSTLSAPCDHLEHRYLKHKIVHGNNPVLNWMVANVALKFDATGKKKMPIKQNEHLKIDGIITLLFCLDSQMRQQEEMEPGEILFV